jgi:hypothetical protein
MAKKKQNPNDEKVKDETAIPLPERDAMSVIGGGGIATIAPEFTPPGVDAGTMDRPVPPDGGPAAKG